MNFPFEQVHKIWKKASNDGELQIITAASKVNSRPQEAKFGALEPPSPQEPKPQGGAPLTRRKEKNEFSIRTGPENMETNASETQITPQIITSAPKVNSQPQEAKNCALEPPYPQDPKP